MKILHIFTMTILLFISPSTMYGDNHLKLTFDKIMVLVQQGSQQFGNNDKNSDYTKAIFFYEEAIKALRINKEFGESVYPIKSSDQGYVYDAVLASYQTTVSEELAYFLNLNIGKSYVGLCKQVQEDNSQFNHCFTARRYLNKAEVLLEDSDYKNKKYTDVGYHLALSYMLLKDYREVDKVLKKTVRKNNKDAKLYATWGVRYGKYVKEKKLPNKTIKISLKNAKENFKKALDINPEIYSNINNLGEIYFRLGRYSSNMSKKSNNDQAMKHYKQAIQYYKQAIKYYDEAIFNNPVDAIFYRNRGLAYLVWFDEINRKKYTEVCRDWKIAISVATYPNVQSKIINDYDKLVLDRKCPKRLKESDETNQNTMPITKLSEDPNRIPFPTSEKTY